MIKMRISNAPRLPQNGINDRIIEALISIKNNETSVISERRVKRNATRGLRLRLVRGRRLKRREFK